MNNATHATEATQPLLSVDGLKTHFYTDDGVVKAADGVSFDVLPGEIFGLVGESGCGKTVTATSLMRLIDSPGLIVDGKVTFDGQSLLDLSEAEIKKVRGRRISMISQEPSASLNPVFTIGSQLIEVFQIHLKLDKKDAWQQAVQLLQAVGIPEPERRMHAYPHEMSGGQAQRVMIAMALALNPQLLIADEPTTALDVTIQAQILDLIRELSRQHNTSVILITHDLGIVAEMCDRVAVMYAGSIVEQADVATLFDEPLHPYTQGLMTSIPAIDNARDRLDVIPGNVPNLIDLSPGCRFAARCRARHEYDLQICTQKEPELVEVAANHFVRCWLYESEKNHKAPFQMAEAHA